MPVSGLDMYYGVGLASINLRIGCRTVRSLGGRFVASGMGFLLVNAHSNIDGCNKFIMGRNDKNYTEE